MSSSEMGTSSVVLDASMRKRSVRTSPSRRTVSSPSAGAKGACTRILAVSPGWYSARSGIRVTSSISIWREAGRCPPLTQRVISVTLRRSLASAIHAVMR